MADPNRSAPASIEDREARIRQLMERLEQRARNMAEALVDTPPD